MPLFASCGDKSVSALARAAQVRHFPEDHILFRRDDPSDDLYILRSGSVAVLLTTLDGRELVVNESCPGECIDELAVAGCQPHSMEAITRKPSELVLIPRADLLAALAQEPGLVSSLLESAARWLRASYDRESALAFLDAPARLALMLLKLDHEASSIGYLTASQEELAQYVGVTRQTAARILGEWRRAGWIFTGRGRVALLNRQALRRLVEEPQ